MTDKLEHDKYSAAKFIDVIIDDLKSKSTISKLSIFSDGAAQNFKSRFMMGYLSSIKTEKGVDATWSFFATSHGKGAVDGIGGTVKRKVR